MAEALSAVDWRTAAFATGPGDAGRVTHGIRAAYTAAALSFPTRVAWLPSPLHGVVAAVLAADPAVRASLVGAGLGTHVELAEEALAGGKAGAPARELIRTRPWEAARSAAHASLGPAGWAQACARNGALWEQVNGLVTRIRRGLGEVGRAETAGASATATSEVGSMLRRAALGAVLGQHDAPWLGLFAQLDRLDGLAGLADRPARRRAGGHG